MSSTMNKCTTPPSAVIPASVTAAIIIPLPTIVQLTNAAGYVIKKVAFGFFFFESIFHSKISRLDLDVLTTYSSFCSVNVRLFIDFTSAVCPVNVEIFLCFLWSNDHKYSSLQPTSNRLDSGNDTMHVGMKLPILQLSI